MKTKTKKERKKEIKKYVKRNVEVVREKIMMKLIINELKSVGKKENEKNTWFGFTKLRGHKT